MQKGWLYFSLAIGIAAALVAFIIISLLNTVYWAQSEMMDQLSKDGTLGSIGVDMYITANSPFFLGAVSFLLLEFLTGIVAFLFARPAAGKTGRSYVASIIAGLLPAIVWGVYMLNNWMGSLARFESNTNVRPSEPAMPCMAIGLIIFEMAVCVLAAVAGGGLAQLALRLQAQE